MRQFKRAGRIGAALAGAALIGGQMTGVGFAEPAPVSVPTASLDGLEAEMGRALFEKLWVAAPSSTKGSDGLGPLFNARACSNCHEGGGRSRLPDAGGTQDISAPLGTVVKFAGDDGHSRFGLQLQDRAVTGLAGGAGGLAPEGALALSYQMEAVALEDGTQVSLRRVMPQIRGEAAEVPLTALSLRVSPPLFGVGQIAAIPEAEISAQADPDDTDGDWTSGRVAEAFSPELGRVALARFGWRSGAVTLKDQTAQAFFVDMGLSSPLFPDPQGDCLSCAGMPHGEDAGLRDGREVSASTLDLVVRYLTDLPVTTGAGGDNEGAALFAQAGCGACHRAQAYSNGARPYSDFLLHDMGADLADGGGAEWRTTPLWGLGASGGDAGGSAGGGYLHDGRALTILEAVLWHGGEARAARDRVAGMTAAQRAALVDYLRSL